MRPSGLLYWPPELSRSQDRSPPTPARDAAARRGGRAGQTASSRVPCTTEVITRGRPHPWHGAREYRYHDGAPNPVALQGARFSLVRLEPPGGGAGNTLRPSLDHPPEVVRLWKSVDGIAHIWRCIIMNSCGIYAFAPCFRVTFVYNPPFPSFCPSNPLVVASLLLSS